MIQQQIWTMAGKMGLDRIPSKSTIARAYGLIPEWYLTETHRIAIKETDAGSLAADSTGYVPAVCSVV